MKNIYILGTPRSGKTTLAKLLKQQFTDYSLISMDSIRNAFIKTLPNLNMGNRYSESRQTVLPNFILEFVKWNNEILNNYCIIEGALIPSNIAKGIFSKDDIVIFCGHGNSSLEEIIENIKLNDTVNDYTFDWSTNKLFEHFGDIKKEDILNQEVCKENAFIYIDTSSNRIEKFNTLILELSNNVN